MPEVQVEKEGVCPGCAKGNLKRGPFPSSQSKTSDILQLVHSGISEDGIKRETTTPHTPEQNSVVERKNRTIVEVVRAMLHDQRLLKFLWIDDVTMPDVEEPMDPIDPPEPSSSRKRPSWLRGLLDDAEGHSAPLGTFRESKKPNRYQGYLTIMSTIIQNEPSSFSDAVKHQVWKDGMTKEYESIMKNYKF